MGRSFSRIWLLLVSVGITLSCGGPEPPAEPVVPTLGDAFGQEVRELWRGEARGFDFWIGEWNVLWRQRQPGEFFHGAGGGLVRHWVFPVLDGKALIELAVDHEDAEVAPGQETFGELSCSPDSR